MVTNVRGLTTKVNLYYEKVICPKRKKNVKEKLIPTERKLSALFVPKSAPKLIQFHIHDLIYVKKKAHSDRVLWGFLLHTQPAGS